MSTQPLTEVERAALAAMMSNPSPNNCWCDWVAGDPPCDECSHAARAVVAAVKPLIAGQAAANVLNSVADWIGKAALSNPNGVTVTEIVTHLRRRAELSRPTSEEQQ